MRVTNLCNARNATFGHFRKKLVKVKLPKDLICKLPYLLDSLCHSYENPCAQIRRIQI